MRIIPILCLLLILNACAVPGQIGQATGEQPVSPATSVQSSIQPTLAGALASGVLVSLWNNEEQRHEIRFVDPATGEAVPGHEPIILGGSGFVPPDSLSADGKRLAAIESYGQSCETYAGGTACRASADVLHLVELQTWQMVTATLAGSGWAELLAFSPARNGRPNHLALVQNDSTTSTLIVYDVDTGGVVAERILDFRPSLLAYALDGTALAVYGQPLGSPPGLGEPDRPRLLLADAMTLEVFWDYPGDWVFRQFRTTTDADNNGLALLPARLVLIPDHAG